MARVDDQAAASEHLHPVSGVADRLTFEGRLTTRWFGDEVEITVGEDDITEALLRYEGWTVKVEIVARKEAS